LHKALAKEQEDHALTKKANIALNEKYCLRWKAQRTWEAI
jgi:hypothetical protein